jgi:hypothetical protein
MRKRNRNRKKIRITGLAAGVMATAVVLAVVGGCVHRSGKDRDKKTKGARGPFTSGGGPLTAGDLNPVLQAVGPNDAVPQTVMVGFARQVFDKAPRPATAGTVLTIQPHVPGRLVVTSGSTLTFAPKKGSFLKPETRYTVTLESVENGLKSLKPTRPWAMQFKTPRFGFLRLSGGVLARGAGRTEVEVTFSGPVSHRRLGHFARWKVGGKTITSATYFPSTDPYTVRVRLSHPTVLKHGRNLKLILRAGVEWAGGRQGSAPARAARAVLVLKKAKPMRVLGALLEQASDGFYVEVSCDDKAAAGPTQEYDSYTGKKPLKISSRCILDDRSARRFLRFNPPVDFTVTSFRQGFRIIGPFRHGATVMRLDAGAATRDGGMLTHSFTKRFFVPARRPMLKFANKGRYLARSALGSLGLRHRNIPKTRIKVRHVPPENLVFWLNGGGETADERNSNLLVDTTVPLKSVTDRPSILWLDLPRLLKGRKPGLYQITARGGEETDSVRVVLTDINLVVKKSEPPKDRKGWSPEVFVWALDMVTARPLEGVDLRLIRKSGKVLARCRTNREGECRLRPHPVDIDPNPPFAILAGRGDDVTYLKYSELPLTGHPPNPFLESYLTRTGFRASLYSDRGCTVPANRSTWPPSCGPATTRRPRPGFRSSSRCSIPASASCCAAS